MQTYLHLYHETTTVHSVRDLISIRIARSIQNLINTFYPHNEMLMQSCSEWAGSLSLTVDGSEFRAVAGVVWSDGRTGVQCMDEFQHFCWWWGSVQSPSKLHHIRGRSVSSHTQGRISALHHFSNWLRSKKITLKLWHIHSTYSARLVKGDNFLQAANLGLLSPHRESECVWSQAFYLMVSRLSQLAFPLTGFVENKK